MQKQLVENSRSAGIMVRGRNRIRREGFGDGWDEYMNHKLEGVDEEHEERIAKQDQQLQRTTGGK